MQALVVCWETACPVAKATPFASVLRAGGEGSVSHSHLLDSNCSTHDAAACAGRLVVCLHFLSYLTSAAAAAAATRRRAAKQTAVICDLSRRHHA